MKQQQEKYERQLSGLMEQGCIGDLNCLFCTQQHVNTAVCNRLRCPFFQGWYLNEHVKVTLREAIVL